MNLQNFLKTHFSLEQFRRGQLEIIQAILNQKDVLAVLPTGGGKSLCYQFPAVYMQKLVIVVSPLIALMKDQVSSLTKMGIPAGCLHSGQSEDEKRKIFADIQKHPGFILYLSPERVQKDGFKKWIQNRSIGLFAIDEAHCVSQWGHDFRAEYSELKVLKSLRPDVPTLALTASATPLVLNDIASQLGLQKPERMVHGFYRPNLYYQVEFCTDEESKHAFILQALSQTPQGRVIIYCGTRRNTEEVCSFIQKKYSKVGYYHAGLASEERTRVQQAYEKGDLRILVATNAFGMGIDQPDVRLVVHYQMPANIDSLYQEMGRAGRDNKASTCLMLYSKKDKGLQSYFIEQSEAPQNIKSSRWRTLEALVSYSEGGECRHSEILTYYKDSQRITRCGHCDSCEPLSSRRIQRPSEQVLNSMGIFKSVVTKIKKKKSINTYDTPLSQEQQNIFDALKAWRKQKAAELDIPAFVVFGDKTLRELAVAQPGQLHELEKIYGIGEQKMEKFGLELMEVLNSMD